MDRVGIRELRQNASRYVRRVDAGEVIEVTDRGRLVARLVPVEGDSTRDRLVEAGRLRPRSGSWRDLGEPVPARRGAALPSEALERMRRSER